MDITLGLRQHKLLNRLSVQFRCTLITLSYAFRLCKTRIHVRVLAPDKVYMSFCKHGVAKVILGPYSVI